MRILGLQFGHDAGIAIVEDGRVKFLAHAERLLRRKHASGLSHQFVSDVLSRAGLRPEEIDYCAIVSTQARDLVFDDRYPFTVEPGRNPTDTLPSNLEDASRAENISDMRQILHPDSMNKAAWARFEKFHTGVAQELEIPDEHAHIVPCLSRGPVYGRRVVGKKATLISLEDGVSRSLADYSKGHLDFNFPATLVFEGHRIPASYVGHHAAHAAATFYQSPFATSAIMTLDGGRGLNEGGLFWLGDGHRITPIRSHYLDLGNVYLWAAGTVLKLGGSAAGKLMGLAPYGRPAMFDEKFVGNSADTVDGVPLYKAWVKHLEDVISGSSRYNPADIGNADKMTSAVNADIAASMQTLFEETMMVAVDQLARILANLGVNTNNLSLSGGCMLNCPTNTRIFRETTFTDVHVEPACDDGGLPAGGALWVYHNLMDKPRTPSHPLAQGVPYLGLPLAEDAIPSALAAFKDKISVNTPGDLAAEGAKRLVAGQVIGWFEGRSEVGPRALGHRSIVADPRGKDTWARVNTIKGRELWRPLAPSVLEEYAHEWFKGLPARSPFMMFVGEVLRDDVPAIAHIDNTARVQTVSKECGGYYDLIKQFHKLTGCAVVLNTSMNGPGEPIAEYPTDAIKMLLDGRFDALAIGGVIVERKAPH